MTHVWTSDAWLVLPELAPAWDGSQTTETDLGDTAGLSHFLIKSGTVSLDRSRVPFAEADQVVVAIESPQVTGAYWSVIPNGISIAWLYMGPSGGPYQQVNLLVRQATADYARKELTLSLMGAELALQDYKALTVDHSQQAHQSSLNTIVANVVTLAGYTLDATVPTDVDMTLHSTATNTVQNPVMVVGGGPISYSGSQTVSLITAGTPTPVGTTSVLRGIPTSTVSNLWMSAQTATLEAGRRYAIGAYVYVSKAVSVYADLVNVGPVDFDSPNVIVSVPANTWTLVTSVVDPLPESQTYSVRTLISSSMTTSDSWLSTDFFAIDVTQLPVTSTGEYDVTPFNGSTSNTSDYTYTWSSNANKSSSVRTATVDNHNSLTWQAGVSAWDFLQGLVNSAKRRLFADESGVFHLVEPDTYSLPGSVILNETNSTAISDAIDGSAGIGNATGVVVQYKPLSDNTPVTDSSGTPTKVLVVDFTDRAFPGPGAAANILARRSTNGRRQVGTTIPNWDARPSMTARINYTNSNFPDGNFSEIGLIQSVEWDLLTGLMTVTPSSLLDAAPGSWLALSDTQTWNDLSPTQTWNDWHP